MSYFLYSGHLECGREAEMEGEEARHLLKSRRTRPGDRFEIQDFAGNRFQARLIHGDRDQVLILPETRLETPAESPLMLELWQALPKEKALDWILQKSVELGVTRIILFRGRRSPKGHRHLDAARSLERWKRIMVEACKQCGRRNPPELFWFPSLDQVLDRSSTAARGWVLSQAGDDPREWKEPVRDRVVRETQRLLVGPEGGLHPDELEVARNAGMRQLRLGPRVMRAETAAVSAVAILQFLQGDLGGERNYL